MTIIKKDSHKNTSSNQVLGVKSHSLTAGEKQSILGTSAEVLNKSLSKDSRLTVSTES